MSEKKGNESEEDLKNKFQRLVQEYTKIKNQNSILKKAVLQVNSIIPECRGFKLCD
jgi:hypothetical protein